MVLFVTLNIDRAVQLAATYNFMHGHGILLSRASIPALNIVYYPFQGWPPGLTFALLPFYFFIPDLVFVNKLVDCLFIFFIFLGAMKLINRLFPENRKEIFALFCLLNTFSFSPFHYFTSTDLYALTFLVYALIFIYDRLAGVSTGIFNSLIISAFLFFAALTRFAYLPLEIVIPVTMILIALRQKNIALIRDSSYTLLFSMAFSIGLYLFQHLYYSGIFLARVNFALHPENLLQLNPFLYRAFFFTEPLESIRNNTGILHLLITGIEWAIFFFILFHFINYLGSGKKEKSPIYFFNVIILIVTITVTGLIIFLSLITPAQHYNLNRPWTYVAETRYYAPVLFFVQLFVCQAVLTYKKKWLAVSFRTLAIISFFISVIYFSFKHYKIIIKNEREGMTEYDHRNDFELCKKLSAMEKTPGDHIVCSMNDIASKLSITAGYIPVSNYDSLLSLDNTSLREKSIMVECNRPLTTKQKDFIEKNNSVLKFSIEDKDWYLTDLK